MLIFLLLFILMIILHIWSKRKLEELKSKEELAILEAKEKQTKIDEEKELEKLKERQEREEARKKEEQRFNNANKTIDETKVHVGYIPKDKTTDVREWIDRAVEIQAKIYGDNKKEADYNLDDKVELSLIESNFKIDLIFFND